MIEHTPDTGGREHAANGCTRARVKTRWFAWRWRAIVGVALLLVVAGLAMRASWGRGYHEDESIVAAYDGGVITKESLLERWRREPPGKRAVLQTPEGIGATIQSLATHAVLERWARERRLDARELFARAMREATQEIGIHDVEQR